METVYEGSNGQYYTDEQIIRKFENSEWVACMWELDEPCRELVETEAEELLMLTPLPDAEPARLEDAEIE